VFLEELLVKAKWCALDYSCDLDVVVDKREVCLANNFQNLVTKFLDTLLGSVVNGTNLGEFADEFHDLA
jgi:hypothetical protein